MGIRCALIVLLILVQLPAQFKKLNAPGLKSQYIRSFARDRQRVYIGTTSGLYFIRKGENKINQIFTIPQIYITSIYPAGKNIVWISSYEGVYKIDLSKNKILAHYTQKVQQDMDGSRTIPGLNSDKIKCIAGHEETVFIGTDQWGINMIDARLGIVKKQRITSVDGLPSDKINHIHVTPAMIVVSTSKGVAWKGRWDPFWFELDEKSPAYEVNVSQSVYINNRIFLGTATMGVMEFNLDSPDNVRVHNSAKGDIQSDEVMGLAVDGKFLWVSLFTGGMARYDVSKSKWTQYPAPGGDMTMDKIFIDGNYVYVGSDGNGVMVHKKPEPEIAFFPEVSFTGKKMNIIGAVVSESSIKPVKVTDIKYRDADILGEFTSAGIKVLLKQNENIYHNKIAYIDFENLDLIPKLWNYEIRLRVTDDKGVPNEASAVFLYDSKKPVVKLLGFEQESVKYSKNRSVDLSGRVKDHRIRDFYFVKDNDKTVIEPDRYGNFNLSFKLSQPTNDIAFVAIDFCQNVTKKGITVVFDNKPPKINPPPVIVPISDDDNTLSLNYIDDNFDRAVLKDVNNPIPLEMSVDPNQKLISYPVESDRAEIAYILDLYDKADNKTTYRFKVKKDNEKPIITLRDNVDDIITDKPTHTLEGKIFSTKPITVFLYDGTNTIDVDYDSRTKNFGVVLGLSRRSHIYKIRADAGNNLYTEKVVTITARQFAEDKTVTTTVQSGPSDKKLLAQIKRLRDEINALKAENARLRKGGRTVIKTKVGSSFYASKAAIKMVKYNKKTSINEISKKYIGNERYAEVIDLINSYIKPEDILGRSRIIVPNRLMVDWLITDSNLVFIELIKSCSYALFYAKSQDAVQIKKILNGFQANFMEPVRISSEKRNIVIQTVPEKGKNVKMTDNSKDSDLGSRKFNKIILKLMEDSTISVTSN